MFTDSHCHLYSEYYNDLDSIIKLSNLNNVFRFINNGCDNATNKEVLELVKKYEFMYGAIGIHPENVKDYKVSDINFIKENIKEDRIIAIGEIGLDYHYTKENKNEQIKLFETQLEIAEEENIPVIIHSRDATLDTINTLKKYHVKGIIHSFSGSRETAEEYIKMGFLIGVNGVVTFKNTKLKEVIQDIPLDYIILETDSPYLTPEPYRGKQNNPSHIFDIAKYIAGLKNVSLEHLADITNANINKLFNLK